MTVMTVSENNLGRNFTDRHIKEKVILRKIKKKKKHKPKTIPYLYNNHVNTVEK